MEIENAKNYFTFTDHKKFCDDDDVDEIISMICLCLVSEMSASIKIVSFHTIRNVLPLPVSWIKPHDSDQ